MKATKNQINYGSIILEVYMLPDCSCQLSKTQVGLAIKKADNSILRFIDGNSPEALPYKDFTPNILLTDTGTRINTVKMFIAVHK